MTTYTSKDLLLSYFPETVRSSNVTFGVPESENGIYNTRVEIIPDPVTGIYNTSIFKYNRLNLADFGTIAVTKGIKLRVSEVIQQIVENGGIFTRFTALDNTVVTMGIEAADLIEGFLPAVTLDAKYLEVEANYTSLVFFGTLTLLVSA